MEDDIIMDGKTYLTASEAARLTGYTNDYIGQLCRAGKVEGKIVGRTRYVCRESLETYDEKSKASVRAGRRRSGYAPKHSIIDIETATRSCMPSVCLVGESVASIRSDVTHTARAFHGVSFFVGVALLIIGGMMMSGLNVREDMFVHERLPLSVYTDSLAANGAAIPEVARAYIEFGVWSAYRFLSVLGGTVADGVDHGVLAFENVLSWFSGDKTRHGMVVVPTTGSEKENTALESRIRDSFSDEVSVLIDETGNAGVITPVFRSGKEDEYLFVMVPLGG
jgi:hypothetical protein